MKLIIRLSIFAISLLLAASVSHAQGDFYDIFGKADPTQPRPTLAKLAKKNKGVVVAGGRYYTKRLLGKTRGSLTGYFYKHPQKPILKVFNNNSKWIIRSSIYGGNSHSVREIEAGTYVMYSWLGQIPYVEVGPKSGFDKKIAQFTIRPGEVIYIGELLVNHYVDYDKDGKEILPKLMQVVNNSKDARARLASEYPKFIKKMKYRPLKLLK